MYKPDCRSDRAHKINVAGCLSRGEGCEKVTMQFMDEGRRCSMDEDGRASRERISVRLTLTVYIHRSPV